MQSVGQVKIPDSTEEIEEKHRSIQIKTGDKVLVRSSERPAKKPIGVRNTAKQVKQTRAKVARLSDLPRLPDEMFDEILTEQNQSSSTRIRVDDK